MANNDDNINVTWTADADELIAAAGHIADAVNESMAQVKEATEKTAQAVQESHQEMAEGLEGLGEGFEKLRSMFAGGLELIGITAAVETIKELGEAIERATTHSVDIRNMSAVLGVTGDQFQAMEAAAGESGVGIEALSRAAIHLQSTLTEARNGSVEAREKLLQLGFSLGDIENGGFGVEQMLETLHERLENASTSASTMSALTAALGNRSAIAAIAIREYDGSIEAVKAKIDELHGPTSQQIADSVKLHGEIDTMKATASNMWDSALVSTVTYIQELNEVIEKVAHVTGLQQIMRNMAIFIPDPKPAAKSSAFDTSGNQQAVNAQLEAMHEAVAEELAGIATVSKAQLDADQAAIASAKAGSEAKIAALATYAQDVASRYGVDTQAYEKALAEQIAATQEFAQRQESLESSAASEVSAIDARVFNERAQNVQKLRSLEAQEYQQHVQDAAAAAQQSESLEVSSLTATVTAVRDAYNQKMVSARAAYNAEIQFNASKLASEMNLYKQLEQAYAGDYQKLNDVLNKEKLAQQAYALAVQKSMDQLATRIKQEWSGVTGALSNSLASAFEGILGHTESFGDAMKSVMVAVVDAIIQKFVEMGVEAVVNFLLAKTVSESAGQDEVQDGAAVAAANAMASVAAIPVYGWALAPAVGAGIYSEAMSFASAAGGWGQVPEDQLAYIHKDEMVMPSALAQGIRDTIAANRGNGATANAKRGGGSVHLHVAHADDAHYFIKKQDLVVLIKQANSRFEF